MLGVGATGPLATDGADDRRRPPLDESDRVDGYAAERDAWTVLAGVDGLGPVAFAALLAGFGSAERILAVATESGGTDRLADTQAIAGSDAPDHRPRRPVSTAVAAGIAAAAMSAGSTLERMRAAGVAVVTAEEAGYPPRLAGISMPPHVLFVQGSIAALSRPRAAAVVGTRRATTAGRLNAGRIAGALVAAEAVVVSGLAYGIDGAAHEAAVAAGGTTVAVIGGGHAVAVPADHGRLARAILRSGGAIVSEMAPDVVPTRGTFPRRNRVISGLAEATIVVQAPARSGALITASWALEQGRGCYLVPGAIDDRTSEGCLSFLREFPTESRIVAGIPQLIADLGYVGAAGGSSEHQVGAVVGDLGRTVGQIAELLVAGLATIDEIAAATDLPVATILAGLTVLENRRLVEGFHGRYRPAGLLARPPSIRCR